MYLLIITKCLCMSLFFLQIILVATNLFGRGMDIERVNIVFNYDMPEDSDTYLHRVARAGRFGTKVCIIVIYKLYVFVMSYYLDLYIYIYILNLINKNIIYKCFKNFTFWNDKFIKMKYSVSLVLIKILKKKLLCNLCNITIL